MTTYAQTLTIAAVLAMSFSAYGAESSRHPSKQSTTPGVTGPVVPPAAAAVPPTAPVTLVPQAVVPPTQTPVMPTAPAVMPTDPVTISPPQGEVIQGTTPPQ